MSRPLPAREPPSGGAPGGRERHEPGRGTRLGHGLGPSWLRASWLRTAVAVVAWLAVWQVAAWAVGHQVLLVSPAQAVARLGQLLATPVFWASAGYTLGRVGLGFLLGFLAGFALAGLASRGPWPAALISLPIRVIRSVPVVSVIILILIWADAAWLSATVATLMVLPVSYANVETGLAARDAQLEELAAVYQLPARRRWWAITLPALLPHLTAAARAGMGLAWKAGVSAEVIGLATGSVGERLYEAKLFLSSADLFAWTLVVVVASLACERVVLWLLGGLRRWLGGRYAR